MNLPSYFMKCSIQTINLALILLQQSLAAEVDTVNSILSGTIEVTQLGPGNAASDIEIALSPASSDGLSLDQGRRNRADHWLATPNDPSAAYLFACIAENGRNNQSGGGPDQTFHGTVGTLIASDQFVMSSASAPAGSELNINTAFGMFPYDQWIAAITSLNDSSVEILQATAGIEMGLNKEIYEEAGAGSFLIDLQSLGAEPSTGILLASSARNEDNFTVTLPNTGSGFFYVLSKDNGTSGGSTEYDAISFVFIPLAEVGSKGLVAMGRVKQNGQSDIGNGSYTITQPDPALSRWHLDIPAYSDERGTLLVSPEASELPQHDDIISFEYDAEEGHWIIEKRDLTTLELEPHPAENFAFSFAFFTNTPLLEVTTALDENDAPGDPDQGEGVSLREAIRDAEPASIIHISPSLAAQALQLTEGEILIDKELILTADSLSEPVEIIADEDGARHFTISNAPHFTLENFHLSGGLSPQDHGGSIKIEGSTARLVNCRLTGNQSGPSKTGGAIFVSSDSSLSLLSSEFTDNRAGDGEYGMSIRFGGSGGAIFANSPLTVTGCLFINNHAGNGANSAVSNTGANGGSGGAISNAGSTIIETSRFEGNSAGDAAGGEGNNPQGGPGGQGGAIFASGSLEISESHITGNRAGDGGLGEGVNSGGRGGNGGGISSQGSLTITRSEISGNQAGASGIDDQGGWGGGVSALGVAVLIEQSSISINRSGDDETGQLAGNGGGLYLEGGLMKNTTISGNQSGISGGGFYLNGNITLERCTIVENAAVGNVGGGLVNSNVANALTLDHCLIANNTDKNGDPDIFTRADILTNSKNLIKTGGRSSAHLPIDTITDQDPLLFPLGNYFGGPKSHLLRSISPAVNASDVPDPGGTDQLGRDRFTSIALDLGAIEFNGGDTSHAFLADTDGDGFSFRYEDALGTNPSIADPNHPNHPRMLPNGQLTFGVNPEPIGDNFWSIRSSTNLIQFGENEYSSSRPPDTPFTDTTPPVGSRVFYRISISVNK